jgi:RHS repeat-associated protein
MTPMRAATALPEAPFEGQELALRRSGFLRELASGLDALQPANTNGESARAYDESASESCTWTSKDPLRFEGAVNLYEYSSTDPVNRFDSSGRNPATAIYVGYVLDDLYALFLAAITEPLWGPQQGAGPTVTGGAPPIPGVWVDPSPPLPDVTDTSGDDVSVGDDVADGVCDFATSKTKKNSKKECSCVCHRAGANPINPIGPRTKARCATDCASKGYTGYRCGGGDVTWFP